MRIFVILAAAIGGLAFWRRKTLKDDVARATDAGKDAASKVGSRLNHDSAETADDESSDDESSDDESSDDESSDDESSDDEPEVSEADAPAG